MIYRRVNIGVGSEIGRDDNWRHLEQHRDTPLHQLFGAVRGVVCHTSPGTGESLTILLWIDNRSAVAYINHMGGTHSSQWAIQFWSWALKKGIFLIAKHIAGKDYISADWMSCAHRDWTDWMLNQEFFSEDQPTMGPSGSGFVCHKAVSTAPTLLQLETGTSSRESGCIPSRLSKDMHTTLGAWYPDVWRKPEINVPQLQWF